MTDQITKPGIYQMPAEQYHRDLAPIASLSCSIAKKLLSHSPLHAWIEHPRLNPAYVADNNSRFDIGTLAHALLLERDESRLVVLPFDDWKKKAAREERDAAWADGKLPILTAQADRVTAMVRVARDFMQNCELADVFANGRAEQSVLWKEGEAWLRCRPDWLAHDNRTVIDYKTTDSASPAAFHRVMASMGYDVQDVFYSRGITAVTGEHPQFFFMAQEIEAPFACSLHAISEAWLTIAEALVQRAIDKWSNCQKHNIWPAYSLAIAYADPPTWKLYEHERQTGEQP